ncbi:hypothetical protein EYC84_001487 [Monilinia fructicola]|uniref:Uncharacterized protein n=1 Tax=Monilinia fructicola TaxID=38448 RepID=A0A5M9JS17_MONFR|nr:hypothetical protein EYC84_001487 [Monilinia fructicola]
MPGNSIQNILGSGLCWLGGDSKDHEKKKKRRKEQSQDPTKESLKFHQAARAMGLESDSEDENFNTNRRRKYREKGRYDPPMDLSTPFGSPFTETRHMTHNNATATSDPSLESRSGTTISYGATDGYQRAIWQDRGAQESGQENNFIQASPRVTGSLRNSEYPSTDLGRSGDPWDEEILTHSTPGAYIKSHRRARNLRVDHPEEIGWPKNHRSSDKIPVESPTEAYSPRDRTSSRGVADAYQGNQRRSTDQQGFSPALINYRPHPDQSLTRCEMLRREILRLLLVVHMQNSHHTLHRTPFPSDPPYHPQLAPRPRQKETQKLQPKPPPTKPIKPRPTDKKTSRKPENDEAETSKTANTHSRNQDPPNPAPQSVSPSSPPPQPPPSNPTTPGPATEIHPRIPAPAPSPVPIGPPLLAPLHRPIAPPPHNRPSPLPNHPAHLPPQRLDPPQQHPEARHPPRLPRHPAQWPPAHGGTLAPDVPARVCRRAGAGRSGVAAGNEARRIARIAVPAGERRWGVELEAERR